ncbi:glycosyl hydrolase 108 family protein, partial [Mixta calida]
QVWIQAERNLDVNVKNDATRHIGSNHSHYVRKNELHRVEANQVQAVKGGTEILTGQGKLDATVEQYVLASGSQLRLICGNSAIELNANGQINLVGKGFNLFVEGDGNITTSGGKLNLNTAGAKPGTTAPGPDHKQDIKQAVEAQFTPGKESKSAAPAQKGHAAGQANIVSASRTPSKNNGDNFTKISAVVLENEGGYANRAADKGGPTNRGIAWNTWKKYAKEDLGVEPTLDNLKKITREQAEVIYKKRYWDPSGFNEIKDPKLALMSYDWTITSGGAGRKIQSLLKEEYGKNINVDGVIGPKTIEAMNSVADSKNLTERIGAIRKDYYENLVLKDPGQAVNLKGWLNRVNRCLDLEME